MRNLSLTPEQRSLQARMAAHIMHSQHDPAETTAAAHRAAHVGRYEREVDPDGTMEPGERARRVESARRAHMAKLALASSKARAERKAARR